MHEYTINRCAEMLERDRASVARALRNVPPDAGTPKRPLYRLATVTKALTAHHAKPDGRRGNGDDARLTAARAELAREQTAAIALKNAVARGEYVPLAAIQKSAEAIFATFRERVLTIPGKTAALCEGRSRAEIEEIVRGEVYECLDELSGIKAVGESRGDDIGEVGNEAVEAD
jgi:phage terminase Nu1 subunit (DNA packaging protein)